jgi:hypothetical protein
VKNTPAAIRLPCIQAYANCHAIDAIAAIGRCLASTPTLGRDETAGDMLVLRVYGPGQDRSRL